MPDSVLHIVGDVHLGRKFVTGVPLHRRGDRELMVWNQFETELRGCTSKLFVQTGDLFNDFTVEEALVLQTARLVRSVAEASPSLDYIFYRGNHDASKDANKASSFDVFAELLMGLPNVHIFTDEVSLFRVTTTGETFGFIPWSPFTSAEDLALELQYAKVTLGIGTPLDAVFGHWDVESFGGSTFNLVPTGVLQNITKKVYTGHIHKPTKIERDGIEIEVVGSMQPYSHAEDPSTTWYKTTTFEDFSLYGETEKAWCRNLNLRIMVKPGEVPEPIDCLSFITKNVAEKDEDEGDLQVGFDEFNMDNLFHDSLLERKVGISVSEQIMMKFKELRNGQS